MSRDADKEEFVTSLARGLEVIRAFDRGRPEMTLSEVAAATGLNPAVARRFLRTLVHLGYAAQVGRRFILRPRVLELGAGYFRSMNLAEVAQPHLQQLRDVTGDTASFTTLDGPDVLHICHAPTEGMLRFEITSGSKVPAYVSATGRAMLANLEPGALDAYLARSELVALTTATVTSESELRAELKAVRDQGYSLVVDELDYGVTALGVPVFLEGRGVAGVSCVAPTGRIHDQDFVATRLPPLQEAADRIAREVLRFPALAHSLTSESTGQLAPS